MIDAIWQDIKYAARSLVRRPLVTAITVLSLALGIGVNTAIFSVFERLLLRSLPVPAPDEIVHIVSPGPRPGNTSTDNGGDRNHVFSYPLFRDLEKLENTGLAGIAAHRGFAANVAHGGRTERADGLIVSGAYFPTLGVSPVVGRLLTPDDDRVPGGHPVVVLAHSYWETRFGADPGVIDETLAVNGVPMTIVGVAATGFVGTQLSDPPAIFAPLAMREQMRAGGDQRTNHWLYLFGRLRPGVTRDQAQAALNVPFAGLIRDVEFPVQRAGLGDRAREQFLARQIVLEDGSRGRMADRDEASLILGLLLAVTGLVLLIACANVANLLLTRAADRSTEMAVRLSIGASTPSLIRLVLVEACLLGVMGAIGALGVSKATTLALLDLMPADDAPIVQFELNTAVLLFTLALGLGTALLFGLFPALQAIRSGLLSTAGAQSSRSSTSRGAARFRTSLATSQIALATVLLAQAGLFITSLVNVGRVELGIRREGIIGFRLSPSLNGYAPERAQALFDRVEDELRGLPGVLSATTSTQPLLADMAQEPNVTVEGFDAGPDPDMRTSFARIGTDYFRTLGIPLLAGREFSRDDAADAPKVAIVNEAFARKFNLQSGVLGRRLALGAGNRALDIAIVGLVRDTKYDEVRAPAPPQLYLPARQAALGSLTFYARHSGEAGQLRTVIPALVARADPNLPVERLRTMDEQIWDNVTRDRVLATLSSWFAALATILAAVGLYAVLAYTVAQRLREIGIRVALGARPGDVRRLVFTQVGRMALVGGAVGLAAAFALGRLGEALLFGVEGDNPALVGGAAIAMAAVTIIAAALPARRAASVDPVAALRAE